MNEILEILKYILPALVVFLASYLILKKMISLEESKRKIDLALKNQQLITPIKLQAYERLTLFLERISPDNLIMRSNVHKKTTKQLQSELLGIIRSEYDHNLSQQIYISAQAWNIIKSAKENTIKFINHTCDQMKPDDPGINFSQKLLKNMVNLESLPSKVAIEFLKKEIRQVF